MLIAIRSGVGSVIGDKEKEFYGVKKSDVEDGVEGYTSKPRR